MSSSNPPNRPHRLPGANSPELLSRLLETIASGVRSTRGLEEALGLEPRAVNHYLHTGQWLGFLVAPATLSPLGLAYVYGGAERPRIYAETLWANSDVSALLSSGDGTPSDEQIRAYISVRAPNAAEDSMALRVSSLRALLAPAVGWRSQVDQTEATEQLGLPLSTTSPERAASRTAEARVAAGLGGLYHQVLCTLLDYGELSLGALRAFFDQWGAVDEDLGASMELAVQRGDAVRMGDALVVSRGALERRAIVATTASVILSDPAYRQHLADRGSNTPTVTHTSDRARRRHEAWDDHLFGRDAAPETLQADLERVLLERPLSSFPLAGRAGPEIALRQEPFLDVWAEGRGLIALPPSLATLQAGLDAVNRSLKHKRPHGGVALPDLGWSQRRVHGGLFSPGEALPRSVPDLRSLQARAVRHAPYVSMTVALLLAHRTRPDRLQVMQRQGQWSVVSAEGVVGDLLWVLDTCASSIGWLASRRLQGGLAADAFLVSLQCIGLVTIVEGLAVLDDAFFQRLREGEEEQEELSGLQPLAHLLERHVSQMEAAETTPRGR